MKQYFEDEPVIAWAMAAIVVGYVLLLFSQHSAPSGAVVLFYLVLALPFVLIVIQVHRRHKDHIGPVVAFGVACASAWYTLFILGLSRHPEVPDNAATGAIYSGILGIGALLMLQFLLGHDEETSEVVPPAEPPPAVSKTLVEWIEGHRPVLPVHVRSAFILCADEFLLHYKAERFDPTTDPLVVARRAANPSPPIAEVQLAIFEAYQKFAARLARPPDEVPPLPFTGVFTKQTRGALLELDAPLKPYLPWAYTLDDTLTAWSRRADLSFMPFVNSPFVKLLPIVADGIHAGDARYQSMFILAPSGSGKTNLLNHLLQADMKAVEQGTLSLIVMDSQGDFLRELRGDPRFHPETGTLKDRLVIIEPDLNYPIALNPFTLGRKRVNEEDANEREANRSNTLELLTHVFATLGEGAEFTFKQRDLYSNCLRLCMEIEGATLHTLYEIVDQGVGKYAAEISRLPVPAQRFFANEFNDKANYHGTRSEVRYRVGNLLSNPTFASIFTEPNAKLDLYEELDAGKIIIVDTNKRRLSETGSSLFGRFIIALVQSAVRERTTARKPTFFYIDEAHEYLDNDRHVARMIDEVRKYKLGLVLVTQRLSKIKDENPGVTSTLHKIIDGVCEVVH